MANFKEEDFINELLFCLEKIDFVKSRALLQYTPQVSPRAQKRILYEVSKAEGQVAYPLLEILYDMKELSPEMQEKLYELIVANLYDHPEHVISSITNKQVKRKSVYIKLAGDLKVKDAIPAIENILMNETDKKTLLSAIQSAGALQAESSIPILSEFIEYDDVKFKQQAITALAEFNQPRVIDILVNSIRNGESKTDQIIIDALAKIQTQYTLDKLSEMIGSQFTGIRNIVMDCLQKIGPKAVPTLIKAVDSDSTDTVIHVLTTLGHIGDGTALPAIHKALKTANNANVRFAIYEAMERIPSPKSAIYLANGLDDPEEHVRLAAAKAIDKNLSSVLLGGLKNIVEANDDHAKNVVSVLIDSGSEQAFTNLLESETFTELATEHIAQNIHPDTKNHFINLLKDAGKNDIAKKIEKTVVKVAQDNRPIVMVVDDSKMMIKIYKKKLYEMDLRSMAFEFPVEAIKVLKKTKPNLLVTDLNMPTINGLELSKFARTLYNKKELPILMITTQSDFVSRSKSKQSESISKDEIVKSGANMILTKPFSDEDLAKAISKLLVK